MKRATAEGSEFRVKFECRRSGRLSASLPSTISDLGFRGETGMPSIAEVGSSDEVIRPVTSVTANLPSLVPPEELALTVESQPLMCSSIEGFPLVREDVLSDQPHDYSGGQRGLEIRYTGLQGDDSESRGRGIKVGHSSIVSATSGLDDVLAKGEDGADTYAGSMGDSFVDAERVPPVQSMHPSDATETPGDFLVWAPSQLRVEGEGGEQGAGNATVLNILPALVGSFAPVSVPDSAPHVLGGPVAVGDSPCFPDDVILSPSLAPLLVADMCRIGGGRMVREEGRDPPVAKEAVRPQPADGLRQLPRSSEESLP
ncbi:hypothetical protein Dimus_018384, partial [Dionaea muscipula]